jgi:hypothetical protein
MVLVLDGATLDINRNSVEGETDMPLDPINPFTDGGYHYEETSDDWKLACSVLPSFAALRWPGYETAVVEDTIDGQAVVIQLWKGRCQRFFGLNDFPGGIGAEVGVYRRIPGRPLPTALPALPSEIAGFMLHAVHALGEDFWWPYPELQTQVSFTFVNPKTNATFFTAGPETTYWMNRWMRPDSYRLYEGSNSPLPFWTEDYILNYTINGRSNTADGRPFSW